MSILVRTPDHGEFIFKGAEGFNHYDGELYIDDAKGVQVAAFAKGFWIYVTKHAEVPA